MNKSYKVCIVLIFGLFIQPSHAYCQKAALTVDQLQDLATLGRRITTKKATVTTGSPYLIDKFVRGTATLKNNSKTNVMKIRYNMLNNHLQFIRNGKPMTAKPDQIKQFAIITKDKNIVFKNGYHTNVDDISAETLLRTVYDGKVKLVVRHKAVLWKNQPTYNSATQKNKYEAFRNYYLITADGTFHRLKHIKRDVLGILSDHRKALKQYAITHNLNFNNELELTKILKYYNSIK